MFFLSFFTQGFPFATLAIAFVPFLVAMVKKKDIAVAEAELKRAKATPAQPVDPVEPPRKRLRQKGDGSERSPAEVSTTPSASSSRADEKLPQPPCEPTWDNFEKIMNHYKLSERDTTAILLSVCGPDKRGSGFWQHYQDRVKAELQQDVKVKVESAQPTPPTPKDTQDVEVVEPPQLPDNQLGDRSIFPHGPQGPPADQYEEALDPDYALEGEGEEEECHEDDPVIDGTVPPAAPEDVGTGAPRTPEDPDFQAALEASLESLENVEPPKESRRSSGRYVSRAIRLDDDDDDLKRGPSLLLLAFDYLED